jgi:hypothetical protein
MCCSSSTSMMSAEGMNVEGRLLQLEEAKVREAQSHSFSCLELVVD